MKWTALALLAILGLAAPAAAADKKKKEAPITDPEALFKKVDGDANAFLTLDEFKKIADYLPVPKVKKGEKPPVHDFDKVFAQLDRNNDKKLLLDEFKNLTTLIPLTPAKK